jgi:hypothetical protein
MTFRKEAILCIFLFTTIVYSCNPVNNVIIQDSNSTASIQYSNAKTFETPSSSEMITKSPIMTLTSSFSSLPSLTYKIEDTWTALPSLEENESREVIEKLLVDNGGCRLPCWWGIVPGETKWQNANQFFESLSCSIQKRNDKYLFPQNITETSRYYNIYGVECANNYAAIWERDELIKAISLSGDNESKIFYLHQILTNYSQPDKVFLYTQSNVPENIYPFYLVLFYSDQRMLLIYDYYAQKRGEVMQVCPQLINPWVNTWAVDISWADVDIDRKTLGLDITGGYSRLKSLEEVTDMNIELFYQTFRKADNTKCINTSVEYWL